MTNLDSILKSRDITLPIKVHQVKAMVFPIIKYGCELNHKESWMWKNWCIWIVVLEETLESLLDCKIKPVNLKGNQSWIFIRRTDAEAKAPILFFSFIFISWRLITLQYCSGFCHTLTWISHRFTSIPHSYPPYHLPLHLIPLGLPSAPGPSTCLMHPAWAGDLFHPR